MKSLYLVSATVAICLVLSLAWVNNDAQAPYLILILIFGAVGAVIRENVEQRKPESALRSNRDVMIACFSPVVGALVALLLATLFLSGLVSGDLFPKFVNTDKPFESAKSVLRGGVSLASNSDFYKMIAWSLVAGYSERFVLSKLDGLVSSSKPPTGSKADA